MPRKSAAKKEEQPSSDEASAHSDVEMQDQQNDTISGFKKFGVSGTPFALSSPRHSDVKAIEGATKWKSWANITDTV
jgi:SWI/SNF-related matrix-associated actin-dependent regulator of chromatin subfamily A member 5